MKLDELGIEVNSALKQLEEVANSRPSETGQLDAGSLLRIASVFGTSIQLAQTILAAAENLRGKMSAESTRQYIIDVDNINADIQRSQNQFKEIGLRGNTLLQHPQDILNRIAEGMSTTLKTTALALQAFSAAGECRRMTPYSPLRPVIDANGDFAWCCNHNPEHCGK